MKSIGYFFRKRTVLLLVMLSSLSANAQVKSHKQLLDSAKVASEVMHYQRALIFLKDALVLSQKANNKKRTVEDLLRIGIAYTAVNEMEPALDVYLNAQRISDVLKNDSISFEVAQHLTSYYLTLESLDISEKYLKRTKKLADRLGQSYYQCRYYNNLGVFERLRGNYEAAIDANKKHLELIHPEMLDEMLNTYLNLSTAYGYNDDLETAYSYLLKAEKINETLKDDWYGIVLSGQIGRIQLLLGNFNEAIEYYESGLEKSIQAKNSDMIERFNRELARAHSKLGNFKVAYNYYAAFVTELESSHERENATAIAEMSAKYENEKKEEKIKSLEEQQQLKAEIHQTQIDRRNLWIVIALLVVFATFIFAFQLLKNQRNKQHLKLAILEQQKELAKQEAELNGQETERNRLSRELHDGLGGTLASIKMRLSSKNIEEINPILKDIDDACQEVRNMSHSLSTSFIDDLDFYSLLTKLAEDIRRRSSMTVNLEFMPMEELNCLELERRHQCYRIIQELTNNAVKHARARSLTIGLMKNENEVILLVEDDGVGFETNSKMSGIGLKNVRKRVENIWGHLEITSKQNEGTTFAINFPFN